MTNWSKEGSRDIVHLLGHRLRFFFFFFFFFFPVLLFIYLQLFIDLNKWRRQDRKGRETSMDSRCVAMHLKLGYVIYFILY